MKLHTLLDALPFCKKPIDNPEIKALIQDHRKVKEGSLFICIRGMNVDGHQFAAQAVENGAVAILAEESLSLDIPVIVVNDSKRAMAMLANTFYREPTKYLRLIGITGTNGKTTVSHLIEQIHRDMNEKTGLIGTMYMKIDDIVRETKNTTPDSLTLQQTFKEMVDNEVQTAVMEVSSHALIQGRVFGCDYDIALFTNLTQDHLDYHHTMEEYRRAKGLLFSQLGNVYMTDRPKVAIFNNDDEATAIYKKETAAHVLTYGIDKRADFMAKDIQIGANGTTFKLDTPEGIYDMHIQLVGKFSVYNILAAITCGYAAHFPIPKMIQSLENVEGVSGRFELVKSSQPFTTIVDYAHTPDSLENVLETIQQFAERRIFVVVGCGGDRDKKKRPLMAQIACQYGTDPIFTSDNPRTEDPLAIIRDMESGVKGEDYLVIPDRKQAIEHAVKSASANDVILIAGKGHETYQEIGDKVYDFDDRKIALEIIKELDN